MKISAIPHGIDYFRMNCRFILLFINYLSNIMLRLQKVAQF